MGGCSSITCSQTAVVTTTEQGSNIHVLYDKPPQDMSDKKPPQWGYDGEIGPSRWHEHFPDAGGQRQSPIDIDTRTVQFHPSLKSLSIHYDGHMCSSLTNNGHTFCMSIKSDSCNLSRGPLTDSYKLLQFHCHWGSIDSQGSEHTLDGRRYAAELHLVHWNTDKFSSAGDAIKENQGIAVLTAFIKVGKENKGWSRILQHFKDIEEVNSSCNISDDINPACLLPENKTDYWTYEGSLTTPPCYESVRFIIFKEVIELSCEQLAQFRSLSCLGHGEGHSPGAHGDSCEVNRIPLADNFRPVQPLNGRVVKASFQS